ncbi:MAG: stage III sporulation protein AF [Lachnospiraceae bacterium]|nr:stage III sporulation protein AF [Clostridiales bacterium]MDY4771407.1 stage III sporulation protein AF [Lachnospiraceae bacterium]
MGLQIYEWMKNLAVFYIFLTVVTHLVPDGRYEEYIRFFMGLLLILLMMSPLLEVMNLKSQVESLISQYEMEEQNLELQIQDFSLGESPLEEYMRQEIFAEEGETP